MTEEVSISNHQVLGSSSPQANEQPPTPTMETDQPAEEQVTLNTTKDCLT